MLIDNYPMLIGGRASLEERFVEEALRLNVPVIDAWQLFFTLPRQIQETKCFLDRITGLWRYEFGEPFKLDDGYMFGPHVWPLVQVLVPVVQAARGLLADEHLRRYMDRLGNSGKHPDHLAEFLPAVRLRPGVAASFEVKTEVGDHDVDWRFSRAEHRVVLMEVKHRIGDIIHLARRTMAGERRQDDSAPQPGHDAALLFRSVEMKFSETDPDDQLQGVWVDTSLQQDEADLRAAFDAMNPKKVHFAILGGWGRGVDILARRPGDIEGLLDVLDEEVAPGRWRFSRGQEQSE